jgi:hypothetical protein
METFARKGNLDNASALLPKLTSELEAFNHEVAVQESTAEEDAHV